MTDKEKEKELERLNLVRRIQEGSEAAIILLHEDLADLVESIREVHIKDNSISRDYAFDLAAEPIYKAALAYDFNSNTLFTTFAYYFIRGEIVNHKYELKGIKLPDKLKRLLPSVEKSISDYEEKNCGESPTCEEIQEDLSIKGIDVSIQDITECLNVNNPVVETTQVDNHTENNVDNISNVAKLTKKEKEIYYLKEIEGWSLKEIAKKKHLSYSMIQRIYDTCQAKIKKKQYILKKRGIKQ